MHCFDALFVMVGATVSKVVPVYDGDHSMSKVHRFDSVGEIGRLLGVQRWWSFDGTNGTESTASRAFLTCNHKRRVATCPTVMDVRAPCFLADCVQCVVLHCCFCRVENGLLFARWEGCFEPRRESFTFRFWPRSWGCSLGHWKWFARHRLIPL